MARAVQRWARGIAVLAVLVGVGSAEEAMGRAQTAVIQGRLCFPSEWLPPMTVYAREVRTGRMFAVRTRMNQERYRIPVAAPGTYVVFGRVLRENAGLDRDEDALYSRAVPCGLWWGCLDRRPLPVSVRPGQRRDRVDVCDTESPWTPGLFERPGVSRATLPGSDLRSLEEVKAVWRRLLVLRTYRARVLFHAEQLVYELDRQGHGYLVRIVHAVRTGGVEVNRMQRVRAGGHAWEAIHARGERSCQRVRADEAPLPPSLFPESGPTAVMEVVSVRRSGDRTEAGGGRLETVYEWRSRLAMVTGWQVGGSFHVDQASGLPARMTFETERQRFTIEYYDFNAPVRVTKPAGC